MPTRPPQVRVPTSGPTAAFRKYHGIASPPEPAYSLMIIAFGPKIAAVGDGTISPSRVMLLLSIGRFR